MCLIEHIQVRYDTLYVEEDGCFFFTTCLKQWCCQPAVYITVHMHRPSKKYQKMYTLLQHYLMKNHTDSVIAGFQDVTSILFIFNLSVLIILVGYLRTVSSHPPLDFCSIFMSDTNRPLTGSCVSCTITLDCTHPAVRSASHHNVM